MACSDWMKPADYGWDCLEIRARAFMIQSILLAVLKSRVQYRTVLRDQRQSVECRHTPSRCSGFEDETIPGDSAAFLICAQLHDVATVVTWPELMGQMQRACRTGMQYSTVV